MKTDLELNTEADNLFTALAMNVEPQEAITILGVALLMIYERSEWTPRPTIEKFVKDIHDGLLETWKMRSATAPTTETRQ